MGSFPFGSTRILLTKALLPKMTSLALSLQALSLLLWSLLFTVHKLISSKSSLNFQMTLIADWENQLWLDIEASKVGHVWCVEPDRPCRIRELKDRNNRSAPERRVLHQQEFVNPWHGVSNTLLICICMRSQLATYSSHRWVRKFRGLWYEQHNDLCMLLKCCGKAQTLNAWHVLRGWMQVIAKLSDGKASHIPYRDSKLTRLLQSSLSGHGQISVGFPLSSHSDLQLHLCCACLTNIWPSSPVYLTKKKSCYIASWSC